MRSRLGIAISAAKLDLIECGPSAEEGQPLHDHIPLYFIAVPSTPAWRQSVERLFSRERAEHERTAHAREVQGDAGSGEVNDVRRDVLQGRVRLGSCSLSYFCFKA